MGPAQDANLCPPRPRFAPGAVLLQQKTKTCPRTRRSTRPGCEWGPARDANLCPPRSRFAPRRCSYSKKPKPPANRRSTRPGCEWCLPKTPICARRVRGSHRGGAPTAKNQNRPRTVGAPAPGANGCLPAPYPVIGKPGPFHKLGVPDISTVQQQRLVHLRMQTLEVRAPVGLPLGHQHQRISAGGSFVGIVMQDQIIPLPRPGRQCRQRAGIMHMHFGPLCPERSNQLQCRCIINARGLRLESGTPYRHLAAGQLSVIVLPQLAEQRLLLPLVDLQYLLDQLRLQAAVLQGAGQAHHVPGETQPPETAARIQIGFRSEEHTSELQSRPHLVCRLLLEKKKKTNKK